MTVGGMLLAGLLVAGAIHVSQNGKIISTTSNKEVSLLQLGEVAWNYIHAQSKVEDGEEVKPTEKPDVEEVELSDESNSKRFSEEQEALVDMAKGDKVKGISEEDMDAYKDLNRELGDKGFPENRVRGPETHPGRTHGGKPHGHVGPVNHIPIK